MTPDQTASWEGLAAEGHLAAAIEAYTRHYDCVSFAEVMHRFAPFAEVKGSVALYLNDDPNVLLWTGMSETLSDAISLLLREQRVVPVPTSILIYLIDGMALKLPVVKTIRRKTPRKNLGWLPVTLRLPERLPARQRRLLDLAARA